MSILHISIHFFTWDTPFFFFSFSLFLFFVHKTQKHKNTKTQKHKTGIFERMSPCAFQLSFLNNFIIHMLTLPILIVIGSISCKLAVTLRYYCYKQRFQPSTAWNKFLHLLSLIIFFLYPGMSVKIFRVWVRINFFSQNFFFWTLCVD